MVVLYFIVDLLEMFIKIIYQQYSIKEIMKLKFLTIELVKLCFTYIAIHIRNY